MSTKRLLIITIIVNIFMILLYSSQKYEPVFAMDQLSYIELLQGMDPEKTALSNPSGIAYSSRANQFYVVETSADMLSASSEIKVISGNGRARGTSLLGLGIENPINITMDNKFNRLLIYQATAYQLITVDEDSYGNLIPETLASYDASSFGLVDPQGMTFDPTSGYLYFLDSDGPRLVRGLLQPEGNIIFESIEEVSLTWALNMVLHGISYDTLSGNFQVVDLTETKLYEFSANGELVAERDLSKFQLHNPQGILFAPSGDQTDDPSELSLYLADNGLNQSAETNFYSTENITSIQLPGQINEFSLIQPLYQNKVHAFQADLVRTINTFEFDQPSPDPSGLTYISSRNQILISDADVEETKGGITHFMGANLWEITLDGTVVVTSNISSVAPTFTPMTDEPAGTAWNPGSGHYFFSDDHVTGVFELNPGIDGIYGSLDDSWITIPLAEENGDPEGIAYDSWHDWLFISDGLNREIYQYSITGTLINHFDVEIFGITDPESIEFNPVSGTIFILSDGINHAIIETTINGSLLETIDFSSLPSINPAGLTYAPASDGSGSMHFYISDRGIDNDTNPNENDGRLFEITAPIPTTPENIPPIVDAGADQYVTLGDSAALNGSAVDDGLPSPLTTLWTVESGLGIVTITDPGALSTNASFSAPGTYVLRLTANDGEFSMYNEINIYVTEVEGSSIMEIRVVSSSDDAEENFQGVMDLDSPDLDNGIKTVGMRFLGVNLPKNALISNAYIQFQASATNDLSTPLTIWGEDQDSPLPFTAESQNITSRNWTTASVNWNPLPWTIVDEAGINQRTTNITEILEEIISRPGWSAGNSMVMITDGTGIRYARSVDGLPSGAPRLHIEYTISPYSAPVAVNDSYTTNEDTQLNRNANQGILKNDTDADGDPLIAFIYTNPAHGTLTLNANGSFEYMPSLNYNGTDSFSYYAYDGLYNSNIATVTITINPVNDTPVANNQSFTTAEDTAKAITLTASDVDGDPLSWIIVTQPSHGTLTGTAPAVTYTPSLNYNGSDSFTFKVNDGHVDSNVATISISVTSVNDAPVANNQSVSTAEDTSKAITLTASDVDGDPLTWTIVSQPSHGTLTGTAPAVTYTPSLNYNGSDSFTFKVNDGQVDSNVASVSITVTPVNDAPVANNQSVTTAEDTAKAITLTASDVDGDPLSWIIVSQPSHGTLTGTAPALTYTPSLNYNGSDDFTFKVNDGQVDSNVATVSITITAVNDAPVADSQSVTTSEDTEVDITLTASDVEGDPLTWFIVTPPTHGTLSGAPPELTYTPDVNYGGSDSFTFKVNDGSLDSNIATVSITVNSENDAPFSEDDSYYLTDELVLVVTAPGVLVNDFDPESDPITAILVDGPSRGLLSFNSDGSFVYKPFLYFIGVDTFTYYSNDGSRDSNLATVTISVDWTTIRYFLPVMYKK